MSSPLTRDAHDDAVAPAPASSTAGGGARDLLVILGVFVVLGIVAGVVWWLLVDPATYTKVSSGGSMDEAQLAKRFDADGWYAVIAAVGGVVAGSVLTWRRSRDFLLTTTLVFAGSLLAAALSAGVGHLVGPADPNTVLATAKLGAQVPVALDVTSKATYLVWPIAAMVGALIVLWSSSKDPAVD
jgi:hypothetical protein